MVLHHPRSLVPQVMGGSLASEGSLIAQYEKSDESVSTDMEMAENYPSEFCEKGVISSKFNLSCG
jgi:hypothetical protein